MEVDKSVELFLFSTNGIVKIKKKIEVKLLTKRNIYNKHVMEELLNKDKPAPTASYLKRQEFYFTCRMSLNDYRKTYSISTTNRQNNTDAK